MAGIYKFFPCAVLAIVLQLTATQLGLTAKQLQDQSVEQYPIANPDIPLCCELLIYPDINLSAEWQILSEADPSWPRITICDPVFDDKVARYNLSSCYHPTPGTELLDDDYTVPVRAAAPGKVLWSSSYGGYRRIVIIRYGSGLTILYGRLYKITTKRGVRLYGGEELGKWKIGKSWFPRVVVAMPHKTLTRK
jgi:hypothetical protein